MSLRREVAVKLQESNDPTIVDMATHYLKLTAVLEQAETLLDGLNLIPDEELYKFSAKNSIPPHIARIMLVCTMACPAAEAVINHIHSCIMLIWL